jgi:hypothetical protein
VREVKFDPVGFVFLDLYIKPASSLTMERVYYKVDSGANCTTISHAELEKLGYDENWIKTGKLLEGDARPTLASGIPIDDCYEVVLPEIRIGDWVGYNWPFMTSLSVQFKFLLGTDSLRFFNWHFDYENDVCKFNLIKGMRKVLFNQKEQSIHAIDDVEQK